MINLNYFSASNFNYPFGDKQGTGRNGLRQHLSTVPIVLQLTRTLAWAEKESKCTEWGDCSVIRLGQTPATKTFGFGLVLVAGSQSGTHVRINTLVPGTGVETL